MFQPSGWETGLDSSGVRTPTPLGLVSRGTKVTWTCPDSKRNIVDGKQSWIGECLESKFWKLDFVFNPCFRSLNTWIFCVPVQLARVHVARVWVSTTCQHVYYDWGRHSCDLHHETRVWDRVQRHSWAGDHRPHAIFWRHHHMESQNYLGHADKWQENSSYFKNKSKKKTKFSSIQKAISQFCRA